MDELPQIFANRIIAQLIEHMVSSDIVLTAKNFAGIRVTFRKLGGSWAELCAGDLANMELLKTVVVSWGKARKVEEEPLI
jgi:hypothetical protein